MLGKFTSKVFFVLFALMTASVAPGKANAYQVDCAILLCLAGGWPASAECSHARAVFIRRITPWPIEPPLQIWRCPMGASYNAPDDQQTMTPVPVGFYSQEEPTSLLHQAQQSADVDISGSEFDFVRSIRVWSVRYYSHRERGRDGDCEERYSIELGSYGPQGGFSWSRAHPGQIPSWMGLDRRCQSGSFYRSVGVEWRDHAGVAGNELVRY